MCEKRERGVGLVLADCRNQRRAVKERKKLEGETTRETIYFVTSMYYILARSSMLFPMALQLTAAATTTTTVTTPTTTATAITLTAVIVLRAAQRRASFV